jgi:hypothetical protein
MMKLQMRTILTLLCEECGADLNADRMDAAPVWLGKFPDGAWSLTGFDPKIHHRCSKCLRYWVKK